MNNSQMPTLSAEDFAPLARQNLDTISARPSLSFWQNVWRRLQKNPRAIGSMIVIVGLLLFTLVGPLLWTQSPSMQWVGQASLGPIGSREAIVVGRNGFPLDQQQGYVVNQPAGEYIETLELLHGNTESIALRWNPVRDAVGYRIYRNEYPPTSRSELGLPLGNSYRNVFIDGLKLRHQDYYYSIVVVAEDGPSEDYVTLKVNPVLAMSFLEAQLQGLIPVDADPQSYLDKSIRLPAHPLGTDSLGRDMLSRLMYGARTSLFIGIVAPLCYIAFGILYGAMSGYLGGRMDNVMMRFAEFVIALPFLLFMILLKVAFGIGPGESGIYPMLVAMVLLSWPSSARLVRGQVLQLREEPYIDAARLMGAGSGYLIFRHMLPNVLGVVLVSSSFAIPSAIFTEAFLSFIGMGVSPPTPSWGSMSNDGIKTLFSYPHELLMPSFFICMTVLAFNLLGDALRDALDAKLGE